MKIEGTNNENFEPKKLWLGIENFRITAVNPEPVETYMSKDSDGNPQIRISFSVDNFPEEGEPHIQGTLSFFISEDFKVSSTGKTLYINQMGRTAYLESLENIPENMKWYDTTGIRRAYKGEPELIEFIKNFANVSANGKCYFENPKLLFAGNIHEIKSVLESFPNNKIKLLCTVKKGEEGKYYQDFYSRKTERPYSKDFTYLRDSIDQWKRNGGGANHILPEYPFQLKEFIPDGENEIIPDSPDDSSFSSEISAPW